MVLLTGVHDAAAPELIALLLEESERAPCTVLGTAPEMLDAPVGARVVLVEPGPNAMWLNLNRPVVRERRLTVLLWCHPACLESLKRAAPDFMDWVSHRVELPPMQPRYVTQALESCIHHHSLLGLRLPPPPAPPWRVISARAAYPELREACRQTPVWVTNVDDAISWQNVQVAYTEAGQCHGLVLADPWVMGEGQQWLDAEPVPWQQATALLTAQNVQEPGIEAARRSLAPRALGVARPEPIRLALPHAQALVAFAHNQPDANAIRLALNCELFSLAETWAKEAPQTPEVEVLASRVQAAQALRAGDGDRAFALLTEVLERFHDEALGLAKCRLDLASLLRLRGEPDTAMRLLQTQLAAFDRLGNVRERTITMGQIADILEDRGQTDEALRIRREEELPVYDHLGDIHSRAVTLGKIADILQARGQLDDALRIRNEEQLPVYDRLGDVRSRAITLGKIADILEARGQLDDALRIHREEELPVYDRLGDVRSRALTLGKIADILQARGQLEDALRIRNEEVIPLLDRLGDVRSWAITMGKIADILQARGQLDDALRIVETDLIPIFDRLGDVHSRAVAMGQIADIFLARGQLDDALSILQTDLIPIFERLGDVRSRAITLGNIADILHARGQLDEALRIRKDEELPVYDRLGDVRSRAITMGNIADILQARGQLDEALRICRDEELPIYDRLGDVYNLAITRMNIAILLVQRGRPDDREAATDLLLQALRDARRLQLREVPEIEAVIRNIGGDPNAPPFA